MVLVVCRLDALCKLFHTQSSYLGFLIGTLVDLLGLSMFQAKIIRPSINHFSSPVLLIQKKNRGWHLCLDYQMHNKLTIPYKLPIPVVDELLDK